ncbi:MAG TPA: PQQ-dependent sugar dehydrogenase [Terriglobales bacterium]|jgi:glucose/arabinose dehydrogenase
MSRSDYCFLVRLASRILIAVFISANLSCGGGSSPAPGPGPGPGPAQFDLVTVATGFTEPLDIQQPNDGSGRLFVVEQVGLIQIIQSDGTRAASPFLDITGLPGFSSGGETGLLGMVFHPQYAQNGRVFINYTRDIGAGLQSVISEFTVSGGDPNFVDPASENILFTLNQPFSNHNGGGLAFGADGFLYIAFGDGGDAGDPLCNGQNINSLLGKILRIDVDSAPDFGLNYHIPSNNPLVGQGRGEIWLYGLRNPFRFSFDSANGNLWIGDVGQDAYEEVDLLTPQQGGANMGWNLREGTHPYSSPCAQTGSTLTDPIFDYDHSQGDETVIGGYVYHGSAAPGLAGAYVFGDFISGRVWTLTGSGSSWTRTFLFDTASNDLSSFGQDQAGELYVARISSGEIARIEQVARR